MVILPVRQEDFTEVPERIIQCPRRMVELLSSPLNRTVQYYALQAFVYFKIEQRQANDWMAPIVRDYVCDIHSWRWAINNYQSEDRWPNSVCPICSSYFHIDQYFGTDILNITCETCATEGYPTGPFDRPEDVFDFNNLDPIRFIIDEEKIDWMLEGF